MTRQTVKETRSKGGKIIFVCKIFVLTVINFLAF